MNTEYAGKTVTLKIDVQDPFNGFIPKGTEFRIEDYWINVSGRSWKDMPGNPAAMNYATRVFLSSLPQDDKVFYGKIGFLGFLIHETELNL